MINLSIGPAADREAWDAFVGVSPTATGYHLWNWRYVFERAFGHRTEYLTASAGGRIVGVLPLVVFDSWMFGRFAVSLPFVNYGGILAADADVGRQLLQAALLRAHDCRLAYVELRHQSQRFSDLPAKRHKVAMRLSLARDETGVWDHLDRKVRNQVRKAEKCNLTAHVGKVELLDEFYSVFSENMRDLGTPVMARAFFAEICRQFPGEAGVYVIRDGTRPVAASITFGYRETIEVPWASSLRSHRTSSANMLLYWTMIRYASGAGYRTFDFGRSTPDEGTFHFKRQWGAAPEPLVWEYGLIGHNRMPDFSPSNSRFTGAIKAWQCMPVWMARVVGPSIVRNIPA